MVGDYVIEVKVKAYDNPTNGAADFNGGCCDFEEKRNCTTIADEFCDNFFVYCLRPFNTPVTLRGCVDGLPMETSSPVNNDACIDFSRSTVLDLPNPLRLKVTGIWQVSFINVYIVLIV